MEIAVGMSATAETTVKHDNTALAVGSGTLEVFATPMMISLMEQAAWRAVAPALEPGQSTVGIQMTVSHLDATPLGMKVRAEANVIALEGRKITFAVRAFDEKGLIGDGRHERFIVTDDRFMKKCTDKRKNGTEPDEEEE
ncbi:MAG: thioesterase family protein [Oscillospiraceae bacterium]|jgi:predicted thioesterase|nr:thioesterase family protein [Oscillospiraceae bacterium]MBR6430881.1 thioesterase family protein [Oscillospiraceae bacterium]